MSVRITNLLFGTQPIAAHCPGPLHDDWHRFVAEALTPIAPGSCPDATVLTWNGFNRPEKPNGLLTRSLARLGLRTLELCSSEAGWMNRDKLRLTADALEHVQTPYVIGADSCDVIFLDNPQIAVERFRAHFACDLLFNATGSRCWPELPEFVNYQSSLPLAAVAHGRHWINSGLFIGKTEFCRDYFRRLSAEPPVERYEYDDQSIVMRTWPQWYPRVQTDYLCQIFQWFNEDRAVMRLERRTDARHTALAAWFRRLPMPIVGAEVGVFDGHTSENLLRALPQLSLWMVDPWKPFPGQEVFGEMNVERFEQMKDAALWWTEFARDRRFVLPEASPGAASRFADGSLDFVFIDGDHFYESVRADLQAWWPKVRPGGLLTGHDYGIFLDTTGEWGVRRAVDEFAAAVAGEIELGADGTWCIEKHSATAGRP